MNLSHAASASALSAGQAPGFRRGTRFHVRRADPVRHAHIVRGLVDRLYSERGLASVGGSTIVPHANGITLVAANDAEVFGTVTLNLGDSELLAEHLYPDEIGRMRADGARLAEVTKLAMHTEDNPKEVLGGLFHLLYLHAHLLHNATGLVVEVHPRHAPFYRRMLGFKPCGPERICPRVNAPAVLLHLDLAHARTQIDAIGGTAADGSHGGNLYAYFFSPAEEKALLARLRGCN